MKNRKHPKRTPYVIIDLNGREAVEFCEEVKTAILDVLLMIFEHRTLDIQ